MALALLYGLVAPKRYMATAYLMVANAPTGATSSSSYAATQAEIVSNPRVIRRALEELERRGIVLPTTTESEVDRRERGVARNLTVSPPRDSSVIQLNYVASDPTVAADTANALARAYLDVSGDIRKEPIRQELAAVRQQIKLLQAQSDDARRRLVAFSSKTKLVMASGQTDSEQAILDELVRRSAEAQGRRVAASDAQGSEATSQNPVVQSLQASVLQARTRLAEVSGRYGPNHPEYALAQATLREAESNLAAATRRSETSSRSTDRGAFAEAVERQKSMVRGTSGDREQLAALRRNVEDKTRNLQTMTDRLHQTELDNTRAIDTGVLMTPARTPQEPIALGMAKLIPLSAVLGLFASFFGVVLREQIRPRLRHADDLLQHTGSPVLASVPQTRRIGVRYGVLTPHTMTLQDRTFSPVSAAARPLGNLLVAFGAMTLFDAESVVVAQKETGTSFGATAIAMGLISDHQLRKALSVQYGRPRLTPSGREHTAALLVDQQPDHPVADAVRALRSQLLLRPLGERPGTMTITSISPEDGRTFVATNLAIAFSQIGKRVLLIDGNLRSPSLAELFHIKEPRGLSGYLARRYAAPRVHNVDERGNLGVIVSGPIPPNPQELLSGPLLPMLLRSLQTVYELIVIDTPAASMGTDAQLLSAYARNTIIVSRMHKTALDDVGSLSRTFGRQGVNVIGTIVNEA